VSDTNHATARVVASGVLSGRSNFRLVVEGDYGPKQIETLVRYLEITRDTLAQGEAEIDADWAE